jgi:hypothetical protein
MLIGACTEELVSEPATLTREQLLDPETCRGCHPLHYREWASSMHAYAALDPVFVAMNKRGQRETNGELGDFCVSCHAPMAVREGATRDGLDLDDISNHLQGVTCYFCHNAVSVGDHFNNDIALADDTVMRAGLRSAVPTSAHGSAFSRLHDRNSRVSSQLCGSCHDIVTPNGVQLERTFAEYEQSVFGTSVQSFETCLGCHMDEREGVDPAKRHEHLWPGVDVAITDFPDRDVQRAAVECQLALSARISAIDHDDRGGFTVRFETDAGHSQPSGAAQDRRMWLEFVAYAADGSELFSSGDMADDELEELPSDHPDYDRSLAIFRDRGYDADGLPVHMFWQPMPSEAHPTGYRSLLLPAATESMPAHAIEARYQVPDPQDIVRVTARLRIRPIGMDVLRDLVESHDLDPALLSAMPTFTLQGAAVEWTARDKQMRSLWPAGLECPSAYVCLLEPEIEQCRSNR